MVFSSSWGAKNTTLPWWKGAGKGKERAQSENKKAPVPDLMHFYWGEGRRMPSIPIPQPRNTMLS